MPPIQQDADFVCAYCGLVKKPLWWTFDARLTCNDCKRERKMRVRTYGPWGVGPYVPAPVTGDPGPAEPSSRPG